MIRRMIAALRPSDAPKATVPELPRFLLHLFAGALVVCILAGTVLAAYWIFSDEVSKYRRRMNAAAYNAQLFFGQREALLRSVAASAVRDAEGRLPPGLAGSNLIRVAPLRAGGHVREEWALILTARDRAEVALFRARVVYLSARDAAVRRLEDDPDAGEPLPEHVARWLAGALASQPLGESEDERAPIVWLRAPLDEQKRLFLFSPLYGGASTPAWIGLEVESARVVGAECASDGGSYALYDSDGRLALHGGPLPTLTRTRLIASHDAFGLLPGRWLPHTLALVKAVGESGWRLVSYVPIVDVMRGGALLFGLIGLISLALISVVFLSIRLIRRRLIAPALRQYEALIESHSLNRKIIEVAPVGLSLVRRSDGALILSNEAARRWLQVDSAWREGMRHAGPAPGSREYVMKDGRSVVLTYAPTTYDAEDVVLCCISDITAQKEIERTLRKAKQAADQASETKALFFATVSHEIRTPLYGILGTMELLGLTALTDQQRQYLNTLQQSSATLLRTVNDTLDLSRIEAGQEELAISDFSPAELLEQVVASYAARAQSKGLLLYALVDVEVPYAVSGDATRIVQILNNLVSNAIKFTESGRVAVRVSASDGRGDRAQLKFQVADTGIGIPAEFQERLFEPYFRVAGNLDRYASGTGLGLAICRRLADLMHGSLSVVSEEGLGTSITFGVELAVAGASLPEPVALRRQAVYVDGAVPEIVANVCNWLNRWGAIAVPYRRSHDAPSECEGAVLVQTWPPAARRPRWHGAQVRVCAPGAGDETMTRPASTAPRARALPGQVRPGPAPAAFSCTPNPVNIGHAVQRAQDGAEGPSLPDADTGPQALGLKILVVEDNAINQVILREQLEHLGCEAEIVANGRDALRICGQDDYDVVITDLNMPLIGGVQLARELRAGGYRGHILGLTSSAEPDVARDGQRAGMDRVLVKPLPLTALADALRDLPDAGD